MKRALLFGLITANAGCGGVDAGIEGTLADGWPDPPLFVAATDTADPVGIVDGRFALPVTPEPPFDLRFTTEDEETLGRMRIDGLEPGAGLLLENIRLAPDRDLAFPARVRLAETRAVTINGLRMGEPGDLPAHVDGWATVLAINDPRDAMVVRPRDDDLPDLPVIVTPATLVTRESGDPGSLGDVDPGDELRVDGRTGSGYVYADRITTPDRQSDEDEEEEDDGDESPGFLRGLIDRIRTSATEVLPEKENASPAETHGPVERDSRDPADRAGTRIERGRRSDR